MKATFLTTYPEAKLNEFKFCELASVYNEFAKVLGLKEIKKFRDKATGVKRIQEIQTQYQVGVVEPTLKAEAEKAKETKAVKVTKPSEGPKCQIKFDMKQRVDWSAFITGHLNATGKDLNFYKEGTIENRILTAIQELYDPDLDLAPTIQEVCDYVVATHTYPRSGEPVDMEYAIRNIKLFVKRDIITLITE